MTGFKGILVVLGATASGKSELAMALAERLGGEILSVDSMQVYRGMNVGTAKPTADEQRRVKHRLVDVADPNETFAVARFVELADAAIADARQRGVPLIATGGTPMYYKALFEGLFEGPGADEAVRDKLRAVSGETLHRRLTEVDPAAAQRIHANDQRRLIRALEVHELTGQGISTLQTEWAQGNQRHEVTWVGLAWEKEALNRRINVRVKAMLAAGWVEEVRTLLERYGELSKTAGEATGYRQIIAHLRGEISLDDAAEQIKIGTRQLARRQIKWFRRFPNMTWIAGDGTLDERIARALAACGPDV